MNRNFLEALARIASSMLATMAIAAAPAQAGLLVPRLLQVPLPSESLTQLAASPTDPFPVQKLIQSSVPGPGLGADVGSLLGAEAFYNRGITGQGTMTAVVDAGHIWNGHVTLQHVHEYVHHATAWDDPGTDGDQLADLYDAHATSVGQLIGGRVGSDRPAGLQLGIASDTNLVSGAFAQTFTDFGSGGAFTTQELVASPYAAYFGTADVINSSWGEEDQFGALWKTVMLDALAFANPGTTHVAGAGNGGDPDFDPLTPPVSNTVVGPGSGYNSITVGALQNNGANGYDSVVDFSSRGPQAFYFIEITDGFPTLTYCLECRTAVDIVAPGSDLLAAAYFGSTGGNNPTVPDRPGFTPEEAAETDRYFVGLAGTSYAAPIVAGAAALLDSASYNTTEIAANVRSRDARVIKAVLLNSADKVAGWTNDSFELSLGGPTFIATLQGLDYDSGAGALNIGRAYDQYLGDGVTMDVPGVMTGDQGTVASTGWDFGIVQEGVDNDYFIAEELPAGSILTATLTWFRERTVDLETLGLADIGQADLDLYLINSVSGDIVAASGSSYNTVEHLHFELPTTSEYSLRINFAGVAAGSVSSVEYGLAWSVARVPEPTSLALAAVLLSLGTSHRRTRFRG